MSLINTTIGDSDVMKTLNILGCVPELLNILMEVAEDSLGVSKFRVLNNVDVAIGNSFKPLPHWDVQHYSKTDLINEIDDRARFALCVTGQESKQLVFEHFREKFGLRHQQFPNLIHSTSYISPSVTLSQGLLMEPKSLISACSNIGFGVTVKRGCNVGHHAELDEFVTLNPGVVLSGNVQIGARSMIGSGAVIKDGVKIGKNSLVGAGSVVLRDLPDNVVAFGNPCKVQKER